MDLDAFAAKAGLETELVERLSGLGLLPSADRLDAGHVPAARLIDALRRSGVSLEELAELVAAGSLSLEHIGRGFVHFPGLTDASLESLASEHDVSGDFVEDVALALGVAGANGDMVRVDDAEVVRLLAEMVDLGVEEPIALDLFQVMTDGLRKMTRAASEMWNAGVLRPLLDSGMPFREIVAAQSLNGDRLQEIGAELVATVWRRFLDDEIFSGTVDLLEMALAEAGVDRATDTGPPCIAFLDLTAFTALTDREGDDVAAAGARELKNVVRRAVVTHGGTLVKMLGDGAMLHFLDVNAGIAAALDLKESIPAAGLPPARFGIDAGPLIVRDVDFYGSTVNVAARLVDYARPAEVLVTASAVEAARPGAFDFTEIGPVSLKGVADPVLVFSAAAPG